MPNKFISNSALRELLLKATEDENLALTKILDDHQTSPFTYNKLQKEICLCGGHGVANWFRGSGTGYLDIVDDVADALEIDGREDYDSIVKYYDEIFYIKGEIDDKPGSSITRKYDRRQATDLGKEYASKYEKKIIIKVMENAYKQMKSEKEEVKKSLLALKKEKVSLEKKLLIKYSAMKELQNIIAYGEEEISRFGSNSDVAVDKKRIQLQTDIDEFKNEYTSVTKELKSLKSTLDTLPKEIKKGEIELSEAEKRLDDFDSQLARTINSYDSTHLGAITGTAGLMVLANLGGFATYTFLTSMMSTLSLGTLGFGAYTAATSFLSVVIGPVGWAGLGLWTIFTLGKPDMNKLILLVATIGAIRQMVLFEAEKV